MVGRDRGFGLPQVRLRQLSSPTAYCGKRGEAWAGESADLGHTSALPFLGWVTLDESPSRSLNLSGPFCETETRIASEGGCGAFVN